MSLEQMLAFLLDKNPHWSDNLIDSLMKNPTKLVAVYTKELEENKKRAVVLEPLFPTPTAQSITQDYLDFLESKEHQDWCLIED